MGRGPVFRPAGLLHLGAQLAARADLPFPPLLFIAWAEPARMAHSSPALAQLARYPFVVCLTLSLSSGRTSEARRARERIFASEPGPLYATRAVPSRTLVLPLSLRVHRRHQLQIRRRKSPKIPPFFSLNPSQYRRPPRLASKLASPSVGLRSSQDPGWIARDPLFASVPRSRAAGQRGRRELPAKIVAGAARSWSFSLNTEPHLHCIASSPPSSAPSHENHPRQPPRERPLPPSPIDQ
jgi:hypothetical protein